LKPAGGSSRNVQFHWWIFVWSDFEPCRSTGIISTPLAGCLPIFLQFFFHFPWYQGNSSFL